jgi:hypothetical protein
VRHRVPDRYETEQAECLGEARPQGHGHSEEADHPVTCVLVCVQDCHWLECGCLQSRVGKGRTGHRRPYLSMGRRAARSDALQLRWNPRGHLAGGKLPGRRQPLRRASHGWQYLGVDIEPVGLIAVAIPLSL